MTDTRNGLTFAPWTAQQVAALNAWQERGDVHPFTCGTDGCGGVLHATVDGWLCMKSCGYRQSWAHNFMASAAAVERGVRETTTGPSQSELDAWRKRATEAETEAAEYQRILREAHEAALTSPAVNRNNLDDPRLTTLRNLATQFASVRESVWMGVTGAARSGLRAEDNRCPHCDCDESKLVHVNDEPHRRCAMCGEEWQTSDQKAFSKRTKLAIRRDGDGT